MPQANSSGPAGAALGMLGALDVLQGIAVTPLNPNPLTPRGKELLVLHLSALRPAGNSRLVEQVCKVPSRDVLQTKALGCRTSPSVVRSMRPDLPIGRDGPLDAGDGPRLVDHSRSHLAADSPGAVGGLRQEGPAVGLRQDGLDCCGAPRERLEVAVVTPPRSPMVCAQQLQLPIAPPHAAPQQKHMVGQREYVTDITPPSELTLEGGSTTTLTPSVSTPLRRSERHVVAVDGSSGTDEDSTMKAMRPKADLNLDSAGMNKSPKSFVVFSNSSIVAQIEYHRLYSG